LLTPRVEYLLMQPVCAVPGRDGELVSDGVGGEESERAVVRVEAQFHPDRQASAIGMRGRGGQGGQRDGGNQRDDQFCDHRRKLPGASWRNLGGSPAGVSSPRKR